MKIYRSPLLLFVAFIILSIFPGIVFCQTARPMGFGHAYIAIADDINALYYNPGGLSFMKYREAYGSLSKYYWGFSGENTMSTSLSYAHLTHKYGCLAISGEQFSHPVLKEFSFMAGYSYPIIDQGEYKLALGLSAEVFRLEYDKNEFYQFDFNDPLFIENGYSTFDFSVNSGLRAMYQRFSFGLAVNNINQPSFGLDQNNETAKRPMQLSSGISYNYRDYITPMLQFSWDEINNIDFAAGIETWLMEKQLALRIGMNDENRYSLGFGVYLKKKNIIGFDYAITYYASEINSTSHRLSATVKFPLPKPYVPPKRYPDLEILPEDISIADSNRLIDETLAFTTSIRNVGNKVAESFHITAYYEDEDTLVASTPQFVKSLEPDKTLIMIWGWRAPKVGHYKLTISLDDDGTLYPEVNSKVFESNEFNNKASLPLFFYSKPIGSVELENDKLPLIEMSYVQEEEPLVPVIFFEPDDAYVDERFHKTLKVISRRLEENPDVELNLYGYIDENTDSKDWEDENLHNNRSENVRDLMLSGKIGRDRIKIMEEGYDPTRKRAGKSGVFYSRRDSIWSSQENRRVELVPKLKAEVESDLVESFESGDTSFSTDLASRLERYAANVVPLLERNPNFTIMVEGYTDEGEEYMMSTFTRLEKAREHLMQVLRENDITRDIPVILMPEAAGKGKLQVSLVTDALIYKPVEYALAGKDIEIPDEMKINKLNIDLSSTVDIDTFSITINELSGKEVNHLAGGVGYPPEEVDWNWKDSDGNIVDPEKKYQAKVYIRDRIGNEYEFYSDTAGIEVSKEEERLQSLVVIQFVFDELYHESEFFSSRLEQISDLIIEKALKPAKTLKVNIIGHTDMTGTATRNKKLSRDRAKKELTTIRYYLINKLELENDGELDAWLKEHSTVLQSKGASFDEPLEIERFREGKYEKVLLGNNDFPEGRSINRRVVIEFEEKKLKE